MAAQRKAVVVSVALKRKPFGQRQEVALRERSLDCLKVAQDRLLLPHDTLIVLLVYPPSAGEGPDKLRQAEEETTQALRQLLAKDIDVAAAQNIRVDVLVKLRTDRIQAIHDVATTVQAAYVVLPKRASFLGSGALAAPGSSSEPPELKPEDVARALPSSCKVMVVLKRDIISSLTGEQAPSPRTPGSSDSAMDFAMSPAASRSPSYNAIPTEVLREVYGETEYSVEELLIATNNFGERNQIAVGGSGSVYVGVLRGRQVAVKRLNWWGNVFNAGARVTGDSNFRQFLTELRVMRRIQHENVLDLQGVCVSEAELMLVFDFQANGALDKRLRKEPLLTWQQRLCIAAGAAAGLRYLHSCTPPIIHRDVKTANILLDNNLVPKVADFGLAKIAPGDNDSQPFTVTAIMGTQGYLAPEYGNTRTITKAIDVFAFGVVLLELVTGHVPYDHLRRPPYLSEYAFWVTMEGDYLTLLDPRLRACNAPYDSKQLEQVLMLAVLCLSPNLQDRPRMEEVEHLLWKIMGTAR